MPTNAAPSHSSGPVAPEFSHCKRELLCMQDIRTKLNKDKYVPHFSASFTSKSLQPLMHRKCQGKDAVRTNLLNTTQ